MFNSSGLGRDRVALLVSPRTGNNWLRHMLMSACDLEGFALNNPDEFDWRHAPSKCVVAMHWHPTPELQQVLQEEHFKVVTLFRHPLDILISILQYTCNYPTHRWLEGRGGSEDTIFGAMPRSEAFLDYVSSLRAKELLSVSYEWARIPGVHQVSYEALVDDTATEMNRLLNALELVPCQPLDSVIAANTMIETKTPGHALYNHSWQGKPNNWIKFLTAVEVKAIARYLEPYCSPRGYTCDPDDALTPSQADANWVALCGANMVKAHRRIPEYVKELKMHQLQLAAVRQECQDLKEAIQRECRGIRRVKGFIRSVANILVPSDLDSSKKRVA